MLYLEVVIYERGTVSANQILASGNIFFDYTSIINTSIVFIFSVTIKSKHLSGSVRDIKS